METFIPSAPAPVGFAAPASGLGSPAAPADASGSASGLFSQILMNSCIAQATVNGEPADAPVEGREEDIAKDDAAAGGEETVAAESMAPAVLFVAAPPVVAQEALAGAEGNASGEVSPAGSPADLAAVFSAGAYKAAGSGADVPAAAEPAQGANAGFQGVMTTDGQAIAEPSGAAPVQAAPAAVSAAEQAAASAFDVPAAATAGGQADKAASDARPAAATADPVVADPLTIAAKDVPASRPEGFTAELEGSIAEPEGNSARSRIEPTANAPRGAEASRAPAAPEGKPSLTSGEGDSETFSSAFLRESARADQTPEEASAESVFRVEETANPNASPSVAAARNAGESVHVSRSPMPEPAAAQAQRSFQAGENAFVLTRKSDTSMEVTLSPPGVGKLEIEIVLDKGVVNATITAADPAGRDAIERSLPQIVQALADEGMAIGGFTVSLKQQGNEQDGNAQAGKASGSASVDNAVAAAAAVRSAAAPTGLVDIFV